MTPGNPIRLGRAPWNRLLCRPTAALVLAWVFARAVLQAAEPPFAGEVRFEQRIGATLPLGTVFRDGSGRTHVLGDYFGTTPAVLYFGYARCPQLCSIVADGTVAALRPLRAEVGRDLSVVSISLDPGESIADDRQRQSDAIRRYGGRGDTAGWHFLTGSEASIRAVAEAAGFHYVYDPRSQQYAHPSGFVVITPDGHVSSYFLGLEFSAPEVARAIKAAASGGLGQHVIDLLLLCFHGGAVGGRYGVVIWRVLTVAVTLTVVSLAVGIAYLLRQERQAREGRS